MNRPAWLQICVLMLLALTPRLHAQPPGIGYIYPPGGKAGTTVDVRLAGPDWTPDVRFFLHEPRVKLEVAGPPGKILFPEPPYWIGLKSKITDPPSMREVSAKLVIPADIPAGPIRWRVTNANGASNAGIFIVSHDNELIENETRQGPQEFTVPATISGRLRLIEEVDQYRFRCEKAGLISCELAMRRLGTNFNGVIEVHDSQGRLVAECVDTDGSDPALTFAGQKDQTYTISIRDMDHRGFRSVTYRLSVFAGPRVLAALPAAGKRGETRDVEFVGIGVASGQPKLESVVRKVTFPNTGDRQSFNFQLETAAGKSNAFTLFLSNLPETVVPVAKSDAMVLVAPQAVTGRLHKRDGKARFRLEGKKGESFLINAEARKFGSPLDVAVAVVAPDGKELASNDDIPGTTDAQLSVKLPADGAYDIVLTDAAGVHPSPASIYRLSVERQHDDFSLTTLPVLSVPIGEKANLTIAVSRENGFKEPIQVRLIGLPKGVSAGEKLIIAPAAKSLVIPLTCDKDAAAGPAFVTIEGSAKIGDATVTRIATVPLMGDLTMRDPSAHRHSAVLLSTTLKSPVVVTAIEGDGTRRVHRGATHLAELVIERKDGFKGAIVLDAAGTQSRHSQGIRGPAFPVPTGADKVYYPVFLPEDVESTTTRRLALTALTQVPDGTGKLHYVLSAMKGQITMSIEGALLKLSHQAEELAIPAGQSFVVPLRLGRSAKLQVPTRVELIVPEAFAGLIGAEPLTLSAKQDAAEWKITTKADTRLQGRIVLHARATAMRDGFPVISETAIEVEILRSAASVP